jgi:4-hydroxy-tetrahydrodipicolinate synthase
MPRPTFRGVFTALVTPFRDGKLDEAAFVSLVERQIAGGVHGLVPVGTTGETATLSHAEHRRVVELCVKTAAGRVPVIAGAGSNSTSEAIELAQHAKDIGADAVLAVTGYYNRPSQEGIYRHFEAMDAAVDIPIMLYNVPGRTVVDLSNELVERLSKLPHIVGIKDASNDMARASLQRITCGEGWNLISGDDTSALGYIAHGGHGCISVTANVAPDACAALFEAALIGDFEGARRWQDKLIRLHKGMFLDASPAPAKFALSTLGLCSDETRLPIAPCAEAVKPAILAAMREAGVLPCPS